MKDTKKMTKNELDILNDFMKLIIHNSERCQNCMMCHIDDTCFFGYVCITDNFSFYKGDKNDR